jgi:hypothetical protein
MSTLSIKEWELLSFFEVEPKKRDPDVPWPYNDVLYDIRQDDIALSCAIAPAYRDVRLRVTYRERIVYELHSLGVRDIRYSNEQGQETLEIVLSPDERLLLKIHPFIEVRHDYSGAIGT